MNLTEPGFQELRALRSRDTIRQLKAIHVHKNLPRCPTSGARPLEVAVEALTEP
jgi:hypothetical protein